MKTKLTSPSRALSRLLQSTFTAALAPALLLLLIIRPSHAGSATWETSPSNGDWNTATNWTPVTVPNGTADTATFAISSQANVSLSAPVLVDGVTFNAGASAFTIVAGGGTGLTLSGAGISNNSGITQNFLAENEGVITFAGSATAGTSTNITADDGSIVFLDNSSGGKANVELIGSGNLDISGHAAPGLTIGSLDGNGFAKDYVVFLGANLLTVGSNNLTTSYTGTIQDGGLSGGIGGGLTKTGRGQLVLVSASTYTGGTNVNRGELTVKNNHGSATGTGTVKVNAGTLSGSGKISGLTIIGRGIGPNGSLSPGQIGGGRTIGTLAIDDRLTFDSTGILLYEIDTDLAIADKVVAKGVVFLNGGGFFSLVSRGNGTLPIGTVFRVIDNTSSAAINGEFSNLPDNATLTEGGNTYRVNYQAGSGNDMTLTVVAP